MTIQLTINGKSVEVDPEATILEAAAQAGIEIPTLCHHPDLTAVGSCRLCVAEVQGWQDPAAACVTAVQQGMVVDTESPRLKNLRRQILEMLSADCSPEVLLDHHGLQTEFSRWCDVYGVQPTKSSRTQSRYSVDSDPNPFIHVDMNQCILCTRCVRACEEVQGRFVWGVAERGRDTKIVAGAETTLLDARCESCGACVAYCPTGALDDRLSFGSGLPDRLVRTTCSYCGVGCQFDLNVKDDRVIRVTSTPEAPVNGMSLCVKGRYGYDFIHHQDRLKTPLVRESLLNSPNVPRSAGSERGAWVPVDWETALDLVARKLAVIHQESGPGAIGFLSSAKCSNEENYLMQKLSRQVFESNNIDHCARLCHSSTVAGLAMAFGSGAMSNSMTDIAENSESVFVIGSNTTEQHPVFGAMLRQAVRSRGVKLIVADPRQIDITEFATLHLRQRPGTDIPLINGLMHLILSNGSEDQEFIASRCEGFDEFRDTVMKYEPQMVSELTGVPVCQLKEAAELMARNSPLAVIWAMGITQHTTGVLNVLSLANLQMLLGNMGVPGGGVNPLRGQNNVQGACDMGALVNVFPGYQAVTDANVRDKFAQAWKLEPSLSLAAKPGLTVTEMVGAAGDRTLRGLYILAENPVMTDPDINHVRKCLTAAEFVVVQEIFPSETSVYADVLLPGTTFAERDGTFTNTERRVQLFREAISPVGQSRPDWTVIADLARRILKEQKRIPTGPWANWDYQHPEEIMQEISALTPSYAGVSWKRLRLGDSLQWPVAGPDHPGTPILHVGRFTRGLGRFHAVDHLPAKELPDSEYPLLLTTGRVIYHWHGGEMTRRSSGLNAVYSESLVEVSPEDAADLEITDGQQIEVSSRRGKMRARAVVTPRVAQGIIFGNFHFPHDANVNNLTILALDPIAKIPEYKVCAVRLEAI